MTGHVTDQSGGVVTGARVEVVNAGTGVVKAATTDERGIYLFTDLQPGTYNVTIAAPSFQPVVRKDARVVTRAGSTECR